jgi:hypothetical protein
MLTAGRDPPRVRAWLLNQRSSPAGDASPTVRRAVEPARHPGGTGQAAAGVVQCRPHDLVALEHEHRCPAAGTAHAPGGRPAVQRCRRHARRRRPRRQWHPRRPRGAPRGRRRRHGPAARRRPDRPSRPGRDGRLQFGRPLPRRWWGRGRGPPGGSPLARSAHGAGGRIMAVAFHPDGGALAAAVNDGTTWVWDLDGTPAPDRWATFRLSEASLFSLAYHPSGQLLYRERRRRRAAPLGHRPGGRPRPPVRGDRHVDHRGRVAALLPRSALPATLLTALTARRRVAGDPAHRRHTRRGRGVQ